MIPTHTGSDGGASELGAARDSAASQPDSALVTPAAAPTDNASLLSGMLAEMKAMREQLGALTSELRTRKRRAQKRRRTIARRVADTVHVPTELEIARARRLLR